MLAATEPATCALDSPVARAARRAAERVTGLPAAVYPRWTAYDQKRFGIKMADYVPMTVTDRAYTSPVWYTP